MPYTNRKADELLIEDNEKLIILSMHMRKYLGWHSDSDGNIVDEFDDTQIEFTYREDDKDGWGIGSNEYISTLDIKNMANGIRSVVQHKASSFQYRCQNDIFRLKISYDDQSELYSFSPALLEMLSREYHIEITKTGLTISALYEYIQPFFEWEKQFPTV